MPLEEAEEPLFKTWLISKLEGISAGQEIADSDVLAEYVLALVKTDDPEPIAKANATENLRDFLSEGVESFVEDVFRAIAIKSYHPSRPQPKPTAAIYEPPRRNSYEPPRVSNESRKRSYHDWDADESQNGRIFSFDGGERPVKQPRRGGRGGYEPRGGRQAQQQSHGYGGPQTPPFMPQQMQLPPMPTPPPGMPPFDPSNPLAALMAMQQAMGFFPPMPDAASPTGVNGYGIQKTRQRCRDYDNKGYCTRGASCPYEHGENPYVVPHPNGEYDPTNIFGVAPSRIGQIDAASPGAPRGKGRGRGGGAAAYRGRNQRSEFSHVGTNKDRSITSIVVEQIPEANFDEQSVRDFFRAFGSVEEVTLQPYKRLAIVKYDSYDAAKAAYSSPKSVFDNRFVKVYWYKSGNIARPSNGHAVNGAPSDDVEMKQEEPSIDLEEVARKQEQAQRRHEENLRKFSEAEKRKQEIEEQLRNMEQERQKITTLLAQKSGKTSSPETPNGSAADDEHTRALKAKLAALESEAKSLGIDPDADVEIQVANGFAGYPSYHGRGGYRGGSYTPRGRGRGVGYGGQHPSYRGSYSGGGGGSGAFRAGARATNSLDNRPKTLSVVFADGGGWQEHEEALRQYLMFNGLETATLVRHPQREDAALVTFRQRFEGENFMAAAEGEGPLAASDLSQQLGRVELAWCKLEDVGAGGATNGVVDRNGAHSDTKMAETAEASEAPPVTTEYVYQAPVKEELDMDTYDDEADGG